MVVHKSIFNNLRKSNDIYRHHCLIVCRLLDTIVVIIVVKYLYKLIAIEHLGGRVVKFSGSVYHHRVDDNRLVSVVFPDHEGPEKVIIDHMREC